MLSTRNDRDESPKAEELEGVVVKAGDTERLDINRAPVRGCPGPENHGKQLCRWEG